MTVKRVDDDELLPFASERRFDAVHRNRRHRKADQVEIKLRQCSGCLDVDRGYGIEGEQVVPDVKFQRIVLYVVACIA